MSNQKKRCNHPDHDGDRWLTVDKFHKQGRRMGRQYYSNHCKKCKNADLRKKYHEGKRPEWEKEKKKAYSRARSRALTRLSKLTPELFQKLLVEELEKEPAFNSRLRKSSQ